MLRNHFRGVATIVALGWLAAQPAPATAQSADSCKDVLDVGGRLEMSSYSNVAIDMVTLHELAEQYASAKSKSVGGQYAGFGAEYGAAASQAQSTMERDYQQLRKRQINDSKISRGDPAAIAAWLRCRSEWRGPSAVLEVLNPRHLRLRLDWDRPRHVAKDGAQLRRPLFISGASIESGSECAEAGYVITEAGCTIDLRRDDIHEPVRVSADTDLQRIEAYAPPATRWRYRQMPYPADKLGRGQPRLSASASQSIPLGARVSIGHTGRDQGASRRGDFVVVMNDELAREGWVFAGDGRAAVHGSGDAGSCGQVEDLKFSEHQIAGAVRVTTTRGDTGYNCTIAVEAEVVRLERAN